MAHVLQGGTRTSIKRVPRGPTDTTILALMVSGRTLCGLLNGQRYARSLGKILLGRLFVIAGVKFRELSFQVPALVLIRMLSPVIR